jgi:creatinine amidohydrolase
MLLYIAPDRVDMRKAVKDYDPGNKPGLTRTPSQTLTYSKSGVYGDPTLATAEKGRHMVEAYAEAIIRDIEALSRGG